MSELHVCVFCRKTGQHGAQWLLKWNGEQHRVHKPCGRELASHAPEGANVKLVLAPELAEQFRQERIQSFWKEKFHEAEERRTARTGQR